MALAFILVNTEIGSESKAVESLRKNEAAKEAYIVYGVYDIVVKVEGDAYACMTQLKPG